MENIARASPRSRQQCRSGSASPQEKDAARRGVPGNEAAAQLRKTLGTPRPRKGRGGPPLSQAAAQAHGARGLLIGTIEGQGLSAAQLADAAPKPSSLGSDISARGRLQTTQNLLSAAEAPLSICRRLSL